MKKIFIIGISCLLIASGFLIFGSEEVIAEIANHIVISEVLPNPLGTDDGKEYVELYNPTNTEVDIGGWVIDTKSDTDADATIPSGAKIQVHGFYLIGDTPWTPEAGWPSSPDHEEEITLTNTDGWVRLRKSSGGEAVDILGWGSATVNETLSYPDNPPEDKSIQRKVNETINEDGYGPAWDTDDNSADFFLQTSPNPQNSSEPPIDPIPEFSSIMIPVIATIALFAIFRRMKHRKP
jgi:hypothetical protein